MRGLLKQSMKINEGSETPALHALWCSTSGKPCDFPERGREKKGGREKEKDNGEGQKE